MKAERPLRAILHSVHAVVAATKYPRKEEAQANGEILLGCLGSWITTSGLRIEEPFPFARDGKTSVSVPAAESTL